MLLKTVVKTVVTAFALSCSAALAFADSTAPEGKAIVALVNGAPITAAELNQEINKVLPQNYHGGVSVDRLEKIRAEALQNVIDRELQAQDATARGVKISEADLRARQATIAARFKTPADFEAALAGAGYDHKTYSRFIERGMLAAKAIEAVVPKQIYLSEAELKAFYEKNISRYLKPAEYRASLILLKVEPLATAEERAAVRARAEKVLKRLQAGEDFARVAAAESEDTTSTKGGDMGYFHAGQAVPELENALANMKVGDTSGVIESVYGFHIFRLTEMKLPRQIPFDEIRDKLRQEQIKSIQVQKFEEWMAALKAKATIVDDPQKISSGGGR